MDVQRPGSAERLASSRKYQGFAKALQTALESRRELAVERMAIGDERVVVALAQSRREQAEPLEE